MCGIAGILLTDERAHVDEAGLRAMTATLAHRGPDDQGTWIAGPVGLGSRRLAVIDLSPRARQPMSNEDGTVWVVFNGEIYNYRSLRDSLERDGHRFRSRSDTETIVHLYERDGIECLKHLRGMFAIALWDRRRQALFLARDRLGKKPLFYQHDATALRFASEPKAILQDERVVAEPDPEAIHHYLVFGYVPAPWSAFRAMNKLPAGHYLVAERGDLKIEPYWALNYQPKRNVPEATLVEELDATLQESVRLRLESDVPIGILLSGGLDSSAIVAATRQLTSGRIQTFSIGFEETEYNELPYARRVAESFETDHEEMVMRPDAARLVQRLAWHYNEPFADSSALPAFCLSEMARRSVTVALSGDGGDELFLGYDRYVAVALAERADQVPAWIRRWIAVGATALPDGSAKSLLTRVRRFAVALETQPIARYLQWVSVFQDFSTAELYTPDFAAAVSRGHAERLLTERCAASDATQFLEAIAHVDTTTYLPDDLLVKMDIASMAHSLEVRSPLLDHRLVEFAASLPVSQKLRGLTQKYLLKRLMRDRLPKSILGRRKMGFGVPIDHWFRGDLRDMAFDLLLDRRATARGYFRPTVVERYLKDHVAGRAQHHMRLWSLLMLELWQRTFIDRTVRAATTEDRDDGFVLNSGTA